MTISAVQEGGNRAPSATAVSRAFISNVAVGNLVVVVGVKFTPSSDAFVAGDCTKSAGTATLGTISLDFQTQVNIGNIHAIGIWSAVVTGAGSCTMQVGGAVAGSYLGMMSGEYSSTVGWDAARFEASNSASGTSSPYNSGNASSAGNGLFVGAVAVDASPVGTLTENANFTSIYALLDGGTDEVCEFIRRIVSAATTDAASWTSTGYGTSGWLAGVGVFREAGGGGGGTIVNPLSCRGGAAAQPLSG